MKNLPVLPDHLSGSEVVGIINANSDAQARKTTSIFSFLVLFFIFSLVVFTVFSEREEDGYYRDAISKKDAKIEELQEEAKELLKGGLHQARQAKITTDAKIADYSEGNTEDSADTGGGWECDDQGTCWNYGE